MIIERIDTKIYPQIIKYLPASLCLFWLISELIIYQIFGIRQGYDSELYISYAKELLNGKLPVIHHCWYISYIAFLASIFWLGGGLKTVILVQILLSGIATVCFYHLALRISQRQFTATLATILLIGWAEIHSWDVYIYTESFFTSMLIISTWAIVSRKWVFVPLLIITLFARPNGVLFLMALAIYFLYQYRSKFNKPLVIITTITLVFAIVWVLNTVLSTFTLIESYAKGEIIFPDINYWVDVPNNMNIPAQKHGAIIRLLLFIYHHPIYFLQLSLTKLAFYLGHIKPYYSLEHNIFIILILWTLYILCGIGIYRKNIDSGAKVLCVSFIILNCITAMLTSESWDGRFLVPMLPFVFLLAANFGVKAKSY